MPAKKRGHLRQGSAEGAEMTVVTQPGVHGDAKAAPPLMQMSTDGSPDVAHVKHMSEEVGEERLRKEKKAPQVVDAVSSEQDELIQELQTPFIGFVLLPQAKKFVPSVVVFLHENNSITFTKPNKSLLKEEAFQIEHILIQSISEIHIGKIPPSRLDNAQAFDGIDSTRIVSLVAGVHRRDIVFLLEDSNQTLDFSDRASVYLKSLHHDATITVPAFIVDMSSPRHREKSSDRHGQLVKTLQTRAEKPKKKRNKLTKQELLRKSGQCTICDTGFSILKPAKQCKACNNAVCSPCSQNQAYIHDYRTDKLSRVCDRCALNQSPPFLLNQTTVQRVKRSHLE